MPKASKEQVQAQMDLIRRLLKEGLSDDDIIYGHKIPESTYYLYKKRLRKLLAKTFEKQNKDSNELARAEFKMSLEDCYRTNYNITINPKASFRDIQESSKIMVSCKQQLAKLSNGPIFIPQLPVREVKEITSQTNTV